MAGQVVSFSSPPTQGEGDRTELDETVRDSDGIPSRSTPADSISQIGPYRILRILGNGGMGTVYEGIREDIERRVAIKVLHPRLALRQEAQERFLNEARAANRVEHPGLVQISDVGNLADGGIYLVMEFLRGETLADRLHRLGGTADVRQAIEHAIELANILCAAHQSGIVHRDVKPSNVMIVADPQMASGERIKLIDFGIAKLEETQFTDTDRNRTPEEMWLGTPAYMSPEQCAGGVPIDHRSDVYALGVVLFQMLTGRPPFVDPNPGTVMARHQLESAPDVRMRRAEVPVALSKLVAELLAKDPARRPTLRATADRLRTLLLSLKCEPVAGARWGSADANQPAGETQPEVLRSPSYGVTTRKPSAKHRLFWLGTAFALSMTGGTIWRLSHRAARSESRRNIDSVSAAPPTMNRVSPQSTRKDGGASSMGPSESPAQHRSQTEIPPTLRAVASQHGASQKSTDSSGRVPTQRPSAGMTAERVTAKQNHQAAKKIPATAVKPPPQDAKDDDCYKPFGECIP